MIRIFSYSRESNRMETPGIAELPRHLDDRGRMIWVDLEDPTDEEVGVLGGIFGFHVLAAEDSIHGNHLPKADLYGEYVFLVLHAVDLALAETRLETLDVGVFMGERYLVTHHKKQVKGIFDSRGQVAKNPGSLLRSPDWLLHGILDAMVDHYMSAVQMLESRIERLEQACLNTPEEADLKAAAQLQKEVFHLNRVGRLQRDLLLEMCRGNLPWFGEENRVYFRDIYDHLVWVTQESERFQSRLTGTLAVYRSLAANQTARAVRMLSVLAAVLLPLMLLAGIFGMNSNAFTGFEHDRVYPGVLGVMVLFGIGVLVVFKQKRWF